MYITKSWLKNVNYRIEVEGVESPGCRSLKIVVGEVLSCEDVETHLHVCQVNVGEEKRVRSFGAPNVHAGIKVIVALPGARIADNYKIKKKNRGRVSRNDLLLVN